MVVGEKGVDGTSDEGRKVSAEGLTAYDVDDEIYFSIGESKAR